jgi:hypothetical protein
MKGEYVSTVSSTYHSQRELAGFFAFGQVRLKERSQVLSHLVFSNSIDVLQSVLSSVERMECRHLNNTLKSGKVSDTSLNLIMCVKVKKD